METLDEKKLDYEVLKKLIYEKMPREYLEENIVEEKHYNKAPSVYVMNFNPYRNGGHILSDEFRFLDNKTEVLDKDGNSMDGLGYNMGKGMWWLPRYFLAMAKYDERHLLPCAFISLFLRHYENRLNRRGRRCGNCYMNYAPPITSEVVSTIPNGIVRHVHCAATPLGKSLRHT